MLKTQSRVLPIVAVSIFAISFALSARADSINSPNITLNVDTNRVAGPGAGGVAVVINTITLAEISVNEYSSGAGREITLKVRTGYQFDPTSDVTIQSATIGFNGDAINDVTTVTPDGDAEEELTFELTSGTSGGQDIIRVNGVRLLIRDAAGAAGPAQTTMAVTTSTAGGAFTDQGIVAANITRGAPDHLMFSAQPGSTQSNNDLLPEVKVVDFGGNLINNDTRIITLEIADNPSAGTLAGINGRQAEAGVATWDATDDLRIAAAGTGYTLRARHDGAALQSEDTVESTPFDISAGPPDHLVFTLQPVETAAGSPLLVEVTVQDQANNTVTSPDSEITLDSAVNPGGWPLLVDTSLTKTTVSGVATWDESDNLRLNRAIADYRLMASGVGAPVESDEFDIVPAEPSALKFVQQPEETQEDVSIDPAVTVEIVDAFDNRVDSSAGVSLSLQSGCGGALNGGAATADEGLATFESIRIDTPCSNIVLEAASGDLPRTLSDPFDVTALPPVALRFVQQPATVNEDQAINPPVTVEIIDAAGKRTDSTATVELTLLSSCGGELSATEVEAVGGLATFAILRVDTACENVTLQATADGLTGDTSSTFDVRAVANNANDNNENENVNDNADEPMDPAACPACGPGSTLTMAPLLLTLVGMKARGVMRRTRRGR